MLSRVDGGFLLNSSVVVVVERGEAVFNLLKGGDHGAAIIRGGGVELGARLGDLCAAQAAIEHAEKSIRADRPERARGAAPAREAGAVEPALCAKRNRGKICRSGHANVGVRSDHAPLSGGNI